MVACSSSSNPATSDASASDGNGGSDGALIDAVPVDGLNADVPLGFDCDPNAPLGLVTVHTGAGVAVIANDVNGEYVGRTVANNAGIATIMVPGCGSVTAARPAALYALVSNVSAGDEVWPDGSRDARPPFEQGTLRIYVDLQYPGATQYWISGPAEGVLVSPGVYDLTWRDTSTTGAPVTLLIEPIDPVTNVPLGSAYAVVDDARTVGAEVHITSWSTSPAGHHFAVQLPADVTVLYASLAPELRGDQYRAQSRSFAPPSPAPTWDLVVPPVGSGNLLSLLMDAPGNIIFLEKDLGAPLTPSVSLDLVNELPPPILNAARSSDTVRPTVSWTLGSGGVQPDSIAIFAASDQVSWRILVPPSATSFRMPELPNDLAVTYVLPWRPRLYLLEASDLPGYAAARGDPTQAYLAGRKLRDGVTFRVRQYDAP